MKKLILFLLLPLWAMAQTSTTKEQEFDYGIKNNSTQTITTPPYLTTTGMDGTQGKIPSALIAKTSDVADSLATKENVANKTDSYTTSSSTTYASTAALVGGLGTKANIASPTFTGTVTAPTFVGNLTGNASSATSWGGRTANFDDLALTLLRLTGVDNADGVIKQVNSSVVQSWLGLGSNAYSSTAYLPLSGGTVTGVVAAPTAAPGTTGNQIATLDYVLANAQVRPYKVYTALYSQNSTSNPTVVILENTLGTVTFTRSSNGVYLVNSSGLFTADKTFVIMGAGTNAAYTNAINLINSSTFSIVTKVSSTQSDADSANTKVAFEIRVYN